MLALVLVEVMALKGKKGHKIPVWLEFSNKLPNTQWFKIKVKVALFFKKWLIIFSKLFFIENLMLSFQCSFHCKYFIWNEKLLSLRKKRRYEMHRHCDCEQEGPESITKDMVAKGRGRGRSGRGDDKTTSRLSRLNNNRFATQHSQTQKKK